MSTTKEGNKESLSFLRDELRARDEKIATLEELIYNLPGNIYWTDVNDVYQGCNKNCLNAINQDSVDYLIGKTSHEVLDKASADKLTSITKEVIATKKTVTLEEEGFSADGKIATYFSQKAPIFDKHGRVKTIIGISHDITATKESEKTIQYAKKITEEANQAKSNFITNLSHDIRTPFSSIIRAAELLSFRESEPTKKDLLNNIVTSSHSLLALLNRILEYSEFDSEHESEKREFISITTLTTQVKQLLSLDLSHKMLSLDIHIAKEIPDSLFGNRSAVERILSNLISNAIKYTEQGGIILHVKPEQLLETRASIQFIVEDTGIGIPEDKIPFIFEKFYKVSRHQSSDKPSNGLGLYIVKQLVNQLGGKVNVESNPGQGSKFIVTIPFAIEPKVT